MSPLCYCVIKSPVFAVHTALYAILFQCIDIIGAGELTALIAVHNDRCTVCIDCINNTLDYKFLALILVIVS